VRPRVERRDLSGILQTLNEMEGNRSGVWQADSREMTSAAKFFDEKKKLIASTIKPEEVVEAFTDSGTRVATMHS